MSSIDTVCAYCGQSDGHSHRCSVAKFGAEEMRTPSMDSDLLKAAMCLQCGGTGVKALVEAKAEVEQLRDERDRAVETRENANAVSLRLEAEVQRLREENAALGGLASEEARLRSGVIEGWRARVEQYEKALRKAWRCRCDFLNPSQATTCAGCGADRTTRNA